MTHYIFVFNKNFHHNTRLSPIPCTHLFTLNETGTERDSVFYANYAKWLNSDPGDPVLVKHRAISSVILYSQDIPKFHINMVIFRCKFIFVVCKIFLEHSVRIYIRNNEFYFLLLREKRRVLIFYHLKDENDVTENHQRTK